MRLCKMIDFESCFRKLYPALCVFAFRFLKDYRQAEDIVQDAFLALWDRYSFFDQAHKAKAFLYVTVRNKAMNILNHAKIEDGYNTEEVTEHPVSDSDFELAMIHNETNRLLYQAISSLSAQTKKVILLSMEDKTNKEIANELNVSIETVKTIKKRAYKILREKLSDNYLLTTVWTVFLQTLLQSGNL